MRAKPQIFFALLILFACSLTSQNNTFSPYSRYGLGELHPQTMAQSLGMGGAHIAYKPDTLMPVFINNGNPASYSHLRFTSLEVGGNYYYSHFTSASSELKKWNANFSYASLGFPLKNKGGFALGILPYTHVGYDLQESADYANVGTVTTRYNGNGGLNKVFAGYGVAPFNRRLGRFRKKHLYVADSLKQLNHGAYMLRENISKLLSDFSVGFNAVYLFGNMDHITRVQYPNSLLYSNTYRTRSVTLGDFTGNFGAQTAITIDSVYSRKLHMKRPMREKVKITFGFFMGLNNELKARYDAAGYNYVLNSLGGEVLRDTIFYLPDNPARIRLPLEQGLGIGFKKGERLNVVADLALTGWTGFTFPDNATNYRDSYRASLGMSYVPSLDAAGHRAVFKRLHYRFGLSYNSGHIVLGNNSVASSYGLSAGIGIPVGVIRSDLAPLQKRRSAMVNLALQYGRTGPADKSYITENYFRVHFGFTFNDRWFRKFRYD